MEANSMGVETPSAQLAEPDFKIRALRPTQSEILRTFSSDEQKTIRRNQQVLTSLATFVGKDFRIPVELNEPGGGWYWDFQNNKIAIDPKDLVERDFNELRFIVSHEGGHRRITRYGDMPLETWKRPGYSFLLNAVEDPRVNNFVTEAYPRIKEPMRQSYQTNLDFEAKAKTEGKDKLGQTPRFVVAGFEYIKQWFRESQGQEVSLSEDLPDDVREVVQATLDSARDAWLTYPSRDEANRGEGMIRRYANASLGIIDEQVWPRFKELIDKDIEDQKTQQSLKGMNGNPEGEGGQGGVPQQLQDKLTETEQQELEQALEKAMQDTPSQGEDGQPQSGAVDMDTLSEGLKQKLKDYIDSLPEDVKQELAEMAKQVMEEYQKALDEYLEGKLSDTPEKKAEREAALADKTTTDTEAIPTEETTPVNTDSYKDQQRQFRDIAEAAIKRDETMYERTRQEVLPIIDELENDLRDIFVQRRANQWHGGFRSGKKVDIIRRIQEKAKGVSAVQSKAWERRELPDEKDYALTMLIDLSGSMHGVKISETFKAAIVLAEVLNRLSIKTEILGFNDRIYEYQAFGQPMSTDIRNHMGGMLKEVYDTSDTGRARWNDDGWALQQASERLAKQRDASEKFLLVLSDGQPQESPMHPRSQYDLRKTIRDVLTGTDQKLIGLGIGPGTAHVENYYPNSVANIGVAEMAESLADVIRQAIANYDAF